MGGKLNGVFFVRLSLEKRVRASYWRRRRLVSEEGIARDALEHGLKKEDSSSGQKKQSWQVPVVHCETYRSQETLCFSRGEICFWRVESVSWEIVKLGVVESRVESINKGNTKNIPLPGTWRIPAEETREMILCSSHKDAQSWTKAH